MYERKQQGRFLVQYSHDGLSNAIVNEMFLTGILRTFEEVHYEKFITDFKKFFGDNGVILYSN